MRNNRDLRVIVTGNKGFIGRYVVDALRSRYSVTNIMGIDRDPEGTKNVKWQITKEIGPDILDDTDGFEPNVIIHLAGNADVGACQRDPDQSWRDNVFSTEIMLKVASIHDIKRFVLASSAAVIERDTRLVYGRDKMLAEWLCENTTIPEMMLLRFFNVYGAGAQRGVIYEWSRALALGKLPRMEGDGETVRDYIHAKDVADAVCLSALQALPKAGTYAFDVCTGVPTSLRELAGFMGIKDDNFTQAPPSDTAVYSQGYPRAAYDFVGFEAAQYIEREIPSTLESFRRIFSGKHQ